MSDDKEKLTEAAGLGCLGLYVIIQIGIPIMIFLLLILACFKACARIVS